MRRNGFVMNVLKNVGKHLMNKRCMKCAGCGTLMGGGMIYYDCPNCNGKGNIELSHYDEAIHKIKALDASLSDDEAKKIFDDEMKILDQAESKPKRKYTKKLKNDSQIL